MTVQPADGPDLFGAPPDPGPPHPDPDPAEDVPPDLFEAWARLRQTVAGADSRTPRGLVVAVDLDDLQAVLDVPGRHAATLDGARRFIRGYNAARRAGLFARDPLDEQHPPTVAAVRVGLEAALQQYPPGGDT